MCVPKCMSTLQCVLKYKKCTPIRRSLLLIVASIAYYLGCPKGVAKTPATMVLNSEQWNIAVTINKPWYCISVSQHACPFNSVLRNINSVSPI